MIVNKSIKEFQQFSIYEFVYLYSIVLKTFKSIYICTYGYFSNMKLKKKNELMKWRILWWKDIQLVKKILEK